MAQKPQHAIDPILKSGRTGDMAGLGPRHIRVREEQRLTIDLIIRDRLLAFR
jgi:hypothetical protein